MIKYVIVSLIIIVLVLSCIGSDFKKTLPAIEIKNGDTFVFVDNSITDQCFYTQYVEDYFYTRYPNIKNRFHNAGVSGNVAKDVLNRFDEDRSDFFAYYTKINNGEPWEMHSRTAEHADIVVQLNGGRIVFQRETSYLPYWETTTGQWPVPEVVTRTGDGPKKRPDKNNIYAFVRIIENSEDSIIVHYRYFPDFKLGSHAKPVGGNVQFDGVVHEYYTIYPDGKIRRVIREGTQKLDDWEDPLNRTIQYIKLTDKGLQVSNTVKPKLSKLPREKVQGTSVKSIEEKAKPAFIWHFDEGLQSVEYDDKDFTYEAVFGTKCTITGPKTVWKAGISGTALAFDGYNSKVTGPVIRLPKFGEDGGFSVEAWVAPGAYSICHWTAIAHQSEWEADVRDNVFQMRNWGKMQLGEKLRNGYFLGIDEYGRPVVIMAINGEMVQITATNPIPLYKWSHLAFTYMDEGILFLYVNGEITDFINFSGHLTHSDKEFVIGKNDDSIGYVSQHVVRTYSTFPSQLGFEGLIDEVRVYTEPVRHEEMYHSYKSSLPVKMKADMQPRTLPGKLGKSEAFGAYYTNLPYHDLWDNLWREPGHPDIVVKFDLMPTRVVFWRGVRSPGWVTETNKWISDQSSELTDWHWGNITEGAQSCCEHMSDYQARHSHVRIIENTDARVVVHWRYASVDVLYKHPNACRNKDGWGVWTDEYLYIYPDGVGVRNVDIHGDKDYYNGPEGSNIGFHDTQFLSEAGTRPEDNIHRQSLTVVSHTDKVTDLDWSEKHPDGSYNAQIIWVNLKSEYKVFEVFPPGSKINVWAGGEKTSYSKYSAWNHYPVTQAPCDGRFCVASDRLTHSALGAANNLTETGNMLLYGFTNKSAESLIPLARSWNHPPQILNTINCSSKGYDKSQRAYVIDTKGTDISFTLNGAEESPIHNPCFVIEEWGHLASIKVDGETISNNKKIRQGLVRNTDGKQQLIVWILLEKNKTTDFKFQRN
jgi:hypothetical protein